jgi:hypothetical protein
MNLETAEPRDAEIERIAAVLRSLAENSDIYSPFFAPYGIKHNAPILYDAGLRLDRDRAAVPGLRAALERMKAEHGPNDHACEYAIAIRDMEAALAASEDRAAVPDHIHDWQCVICGEQHPEQAAVQAPSLTDAAAGTGVTSGNAKTVFHFPDETVGPGDWDPKTQTIVPAAVQAPTAGEPE